jgi:3-oxoacyl-[acyl-carrier-protein] synthase-1/3-oxoacyl-[acyl-carrier-protein] synthase II
MKDRIAVTGIGCICAQGCGEAGIMESLYTHPLPPEPPFAFETPLKDFPVFDVRAISSAFQGRLLDPERNTRTVRMAAQALEQALGGASLKAAALRRVRTAILMGTTVGVTLSDTRFTRDYCECRSPDTAPFACFFSSNPTLALMELLGVPALPFTVVTACASSTDAIGLGKLLLESGAVDVAIAGGADEVCEVNHTGFASLQIYSKRPCRPFDADRDGLNLGSGAGILILEREEDARLRGARPEAFVTGYGTRADGYHMTAPHPEGRGLQRAIQDALRESGIGPEDLGFVNAHGTATKDNDQVEGRLFARMLPPGTPVVSTKGYTGHTLGAAGAIEAVLSLYALRAGRLMKSAGWESYDENCLIRPNAELHPIHGDSFLSTSLGFGGANAALVFQRGDR